jgi:hypothetical protein
MQQAGVSLVEQQHFQKLVAVPFGNSRWNLSNLEQKYNLAAVRVNFNAS